MAKCKRCGEFFDVDDAKIEFEGETLLTYDNLVLRLCAGCAIDAINDREDEIYFETCDNCGTRFDLFEEESRFENNPNDYGELRDYWSDGDRPLCAECAIEEAESRFEEYRNEYPEDFDDYGYDDDDEDEDED